MAETFNMDREYIGLIVDGGNIYIEHQLISAGEESGLSVYDNHFFKNGLCEGLKGLFKTYGPRLKFMGPEEEPYWNCDFFYREKDIIDGIMQDKFRIDSLVHYPDVPEAIRRLELAEVIRAFVQTSNNPEYLLSKDKIYEFEVDLGGDKNITWSNFSCAGTEMSEEIVLSRLGYESVPRFGLYN